MLKNTLLGSPKYSGFSLRIFLGTLDTYTKKMNPSSANLGVGHGKVYVATCFTKYRPYTASEMLVTRDIPLFLTGL